MEEILIKEKIWCDINTFEKSSYQENQDKRVLLTPVRRKKYLPASVRS